MTSDREAPISEAQSDEDYKANILRLLLMVRELHTRGYERLRIAPGMAPSGCYWRCSVTPRANTLKVNGAQLADFGNAAHYSSGGSGNEYFDWRDAGDDSPAQLADKFLERFPRIAREGLGPDPAYAKWFEEVLVVAEQGCFPIAFDDSYPPPPLDWIATTGDLDLSPPPAGERNPPEEFC